MRDCMPACPTSRFSPAACACERGRLQWPWRRITPMPRRPPWTFFSSFPSSPCMRRRLLPASFCLVLSPTACVCERRRLQRLPAVTRPIPCQPCWTLSSSLTPSSPFATALPKPMHRRGVAGRSRSLAWGLLLVRCPPPPSPRVTSADPHPCADDAFEFVGFRFQRSRTLALALTTDVDRYYNNNENSACHFSRD